MSSGQSYINPANHTPGVQIGHAVVVFSSYDWTTMGKT